MPLNKDALTRYRIIDNCLNDRQKRYPTIQDLAEACSRVLKREISTSTIEKDIAAMKSGMPNGEPAPIVYSKIEKGYAYGEFGFSINELRLEEEEWESLAYAANLLHQYKEVPLFKSFKDAIQKIHSRFTIPYNHEDKDFDQYVLFEQGNSTEGCQWIAQFYEATRKRYIVQFDYENIYKNETKAYSIQPFLLKEFRNRWYVIGWEAGREMYLTFALDRVKQMDVRRVAQKRRFDFDPRQFLRNAIGIMEGDGTATEMELEFFSPVDKLVLLDPLHASQDIIKQTKKSIRIKLSVNINPELIQKILGYGANCRVLKPAALRTIISIELTNTLAHYTK
jgi:predicted DNA-binding transcriptional regulator YafY